MTARPAPVLALHHIDKTFPGVKALDDVSLEVGQMTEMVEVVAEQGGLDVTRPDITQRVDEKYYRDLPIITAADVRLAESVLLMQPGYLPMTPNGDPMFRGSQFNSRINGGQAMATENYFDGGAFGYASGHQQSQESAPPVEAIQEEVRTILRDRIDLAQYKVSVPRGWRV